MNSPINIIWEDLSKAVRYKRLRSTIQLAKALEAVLNAKYPDTITTTRNDETTQLMNTAIRNGNTKVD